jgi:MFS family permease
MRFGRTLAAPAVGRLGTRTATVWSFGAVATGYVALTAATAPLAWLGITLVGVGYGTCLLSLKLSLLTGGGTDTARGLGLLAVAVNVGAAVGPLLSGVLLHVAGGRVDFLVLAAVSALGAIVAAARLASPPGERERAASGGAGWWAALRHGRVAGLLAVVVVAFVMYAQLYGALPLLVHERLDSDALLGVVFAVNAVTVMLLQLPISGLAARVPAAHRYGCAAGLTLFAVAFAVLARADDVPTLLAAVVVASAAECLLLPLVETDLASTLGAAALAVAFTLSATAMGVGESLGSFLGVRYVLADPATGRDYLFALAVVAVVTAAVDAALSGRLHTGRPAEASS